MPAANRRTNKNHPEELGQVLCTDDGNEIEGGGALSWLTIENNNILKGSFDSFSVLLFVTEGNGEKCLVIEFSRFMLGHIS